MEEHFSQTRQEAYQILDVARGSLDKSKRSKAAQPRRPRTFPTAVRQRLARLGQKLDSETTSQANLKNLIERLSTDLESYQLEAKHWQDQYLAITGLDERKPADKSPVESSWKRCEISERPGASGIEEQSTMVSQEDPISLLFPSTQPLEEIIELERHSCRANASSTSTDLVISYNHELIGRLNSTANPTLSVINLTMPFLRSVPGIALNDSSLKMVLTAVDSLAQVFDKTKRPEMTEWSNIRRLKPDFSLEKARLAWQNLFAPMSVSPARLSIHAAPASRYGGYLEDEDDPDLDHMDRLLARATDLEVIDLLHYCSLFLSSMFLPVFETSELKKDRDHLGRTCERLLREAIVNRNIVLDSSLVQSLLDGLMGALTYFASVELFPLISIAEISWQILQQHPTVVHPVSMSYVTLLNTLISPTPGRRAKSVAKTMEIMQNTPERYFQLDLITYFTSAYYALLVKDQDSLLCYLDILDNLLSPGPLDDFATDATFSDPTFAPWDTSSFHPVPCYHSSSSPASTSESPSTSPSPSPYRLPPAPNVASAIETSAIWQMSKYFVQSPSSSSSESDHLTNLAADSSSNTTTTNTTTSVPGGWTSETGAAFIPGEKLKTLFRVSAFLLRAEASLAFGDEENCRQWVDEAEKTLQSLPMVYSPWKAFLFKGVIKTTCTFPSGTRTVVDEFERRASKYDMERMEHYDYFSEATTGNNSSPSSSGTTTASSSSSLIS